MQPLALSSNAVARAINVTPSRVNDIVRERCGITADTALRFARLFNTSEGPRNLDTERGHPERSVDIHAPARTLRVRPASTDNRGPHTQIPDTLD